METLLRDSLRTPEIAILLAFLVFVFSALAASVSYISSFEKVKIGYCKNQGLVYNEEFDVCINKDGQMFLPKPAEKDG